MHGRLDSLERTDSTDGLGLLKDTESRIVRFRGERGLRYWARVKSLASIPGAITSSLLPLESDIVHCPTPKPVGLADQVASYCHSSVSSHCWHQANPISRLYRRVHWSSDTLCLRHPHGDDGRTWVQYYPGRGITAFYFYCLYISSTMGCSMFKFTSRPYILNENYMPRGGGDDWCGNLI